MSMGECDGTEEGPVDEMCWRLRQTGLRWGEWAGLSKMVLRGEQQVKKD